MTSSESRGWLTPDLAQIVTRFPVPLAISVAFAVIANLNIAGVFDLQHFRWSEVHSTAVSQDQVYGALMTGFLVSVAAHLFAESRSWGRFPAALLAVVCAGTVALICWYMRPLNLEFLYLLPALMLAVTVAAYLSRDDGGKALWMFNARLALAIVTGVVVFLIFSAGLSAIVESLNYLFGADIDSDAHGHIWMTGATFVAPVAGLSMVSRNLDESFAPARQPPLLVNGVSRLLDYLLVPLALVYVVILHLYALKMLVDWNLPRGQVGLIVTVFAIGGAAVWMIAWPWRNDGSVLVRLFERSWPWILIVPLIVLSIGTWRRISDYGVTPERYGLVAVGLWVAFLIVVRSARRGYLQPRLVIASLTAVLFVSSFGLWGARAVSAQSQYHRLVALMNDNGYFEDGRLQTPETVDEDVAHEGFSIVDFLYDSGHIRLLAPMFADQAKNPFADPSGEVGRKLVINLLNFKERRGSRTPYEMSVVFRSSDPVTLDIDGASVLSGVFVFDSNTAADRESTNPQIAMSGDTVIVRYDGNRWEFDSARMLEKVHSAQLAGETRLPFVFEAEGDGGIIRLVLLEYRAWIEDGGVRVQEASANIILPASKP